MANDVTTQGKRLKCPKIGRIVDQLEYRLPVEATRPGFATIEDEDDRYIASKMYLRKMEKNLGILEGIKLKSLKYMLWLKVCRFRYLQCG